MMDYAANAEKTPQGVDKMHRYKWTLKDRPGRPMMIDKLDLMIDRSNYQRSENPPQKILRMARAWSWVACGTIIVARRADGSFWVIDGQNRTVAARRRSDISTLPCLVFDVDDVKTEADGFLAANNDRKPMIFLDRFKALKTAGDTTALFVDHLLRESGRVAGPGGTSREVKCVGKVMKWAAINRDALLRAWPVICDVAGAEQIRDRLVDGLMLIETNLENNESISDKKHRRRLIEIGQQELLDAAARASAFYSKGGAKIWAKGMLVRYNKGLQHKLEIKNS